MTWLRRFWRKIDHRGVVAAHVRYYDEGRRLMRYGDGYDEWVGMGLAKEHLLALVKMGYNEKGQDVSAADLVETLLRHGLRDEAAALKVQAGL